MSMVRFLGRKFRYRMLIASSINVVTSTYSVCESHPLVFALLLVYIYQMVFGETQIILT